MISIFSIFSATQIEQMITECARYHSNIQSNLSTFHYTYYIHVSYILQYTTASGTIQTKSINHRPSRLSPSPSYIIDKNASQSRQKSGKKKMCFRSMDKNLSHSKCMSNTRQKLKDRSLFVSTGWPPNTVALHHIKKNYTEKKKIFRMSPPPVGRSTVLPDRHTK